MLFLEITENAYMLHVVCTGYRLWLFSLITRHSSKTVLIFKKVMGCSTFLVSVIFLLGGVGEEIMANKLFLQSKQSTMIQASFTILCSLSSMVMLSKQRRSDTVELC